MGMEINLYSMVRDVFVDLLFTYSRLSILCSYLNLSRLMLKIIILNIKDLHWKANLMITIQIENFNNE